MTKPFSTLTATAFLLATATGLAQAQTSDDADTMQQEQGTTEQGQGTMQHGEQGESMKQQDRQGMRKHRKHRDRYSGMMRHHGMGYGMGQGMMGHGMGEGMGHRAVMQVFFAITDANGDGTLSLQEVQDTHARIFAHVDADDDGQVTKGEIKAFFRGGRSRHDSGRSEMSDDSDMADESDTSDEADD